MLHEEQHKPVTHCPITSRNEASAANRLRPHIGLIYCRPFGVRTVDDAWKV